MSSSAIIVAVCSITLLWGGFAVCLKIAMKDKK
ncbi:MetS family NSS transporter small subunit [Psychrilyobacter atlanticus]|nr:MetS family NSS transporter small subunit [Psychrilyobacter atlanticus]